MKSLDKDNENPYEMPEEQTEPENDSMKPTPSEGETESPRDGTTPSDAQPQDEELAPNPTDFPMADDDSDVPQIKRRVNPGKSPGQMWKLAGWRKRLLVILLALLVLLGGGLAWAYGYFKGIFNNPAGQFTPAATRTPSAVDEYNNLISQADMDLLKGKFVTVLLVGVDYAEERETWSGKKAWHSDVMMVLAINLEKNRVDMISLPRDTYAKIPGVQGIYKLNASMDCGGGYPEGITKTVEAAEWMLGGIPIDYYYGVTMPLVKELVDAVGGVDFNIDFEFTLGGRSYKTGMQHLTGQGVLDFIRVRKNVEESGDLNRVNRQKEILVALFKKMQAENIWLRLPSILSAFSGKLITNAPLNKSAALAAFAYKLSSENIKMHSMGGRMTNIFNWNFCLTDQKKRVALIKEIYGVSVPQYASYSYESAMKKWGSMVYDVYVPNANTLIYYVELMIDAGLVASPTPSVTPTPIPTETATSTPTVTATPTPTPTVTATPPPTVSPASSTEGGSPQTSQPPTPSLTDTPSPSSAGYAGGYALAALPSPTLTPFPHGTPLPNAADIYEQYLEVLKSLQTVQRLRGQGKPLVDALDALQTKCIYLASMVNHSLKLSANWMVKYENEIDVDFR
jgi:LCP family protein required for cell wall assembly